MSNLQNLLNQKEELQKQLDALEIEIQKELSTKSEVKEEPVKVKKSEIFFKVGESYAVMFRTRSPKTFECTSINLKENTVTGIYEGKEKTYKCTPQWASIAKKRDGYAPESFAFELDRRTKVTVSSDLTF